MIKNYQQLKRMYPDTHYHLIRTKRALKQFGRTRLGDYVIAELSTDPKTRKQIVIYYRVPNSKGGRKNA